MNWYVGQVMTGKEVDVRTKLQAAGLPAKVPQEVVWIRQGGKWNEKIRVLIPGYVFIGSDSFSDTEYYKVKETPHFLHFLGGAIPQPLSYVEAEWVGLLAPDNNPLKASTVEVVDGLPVIQDGILNSIPGEIVKIDLRRRRAKAELSFMGENKTIDFAINVPGAEVSEESQDE